MTKTKHNHRTLARIPKLKSERSLLSVATEREYNEIENVIHNTFIQPNEVQWKLDGVWIVSNPLLDEKYSMKKSEIRTDSICSTSKKIDPHEIMAFAHVLDVRKHCQTGLTVSSSNTNYIGNSKMGLYLCRHADVLLNKISKNKTHTGVELFELLLCKAALGRAKGVVVSNSQNVEPTPNFNSHVSAIPAKPTDSPQEMYAKSQVYLYEYNEESLLSTYPPHCLPYAVVTFHQIPTKKSTSAKPVQRRKTSIMPPIGGEVPPHICKSAKPCCDLHQCNISARMSQSDTKVGRSSSEVMSTMHSVRWKQPPAQMKYAGTEHSIPGEQCFKPESCGVTPVLNNPLTDDPEPASTVESDYVLNLPVHSDPSDSIVHGHIRPNEDQNPHSDKNINNEIRPLSGGDIEHIPGGTTEMSQVDCEHTNSLMAFNSNWFSRQSDDKSDIDRNIAKISNRISDLDVSVNATTIKSENGSCTSPHLSLSDASSATPVSMTTDESVTSSKVSDCFGPERNSHIDQEPTLPVDNRDGQKVMFTKYSWPSLKVIVPEQVTLTPEMFSQIDHQVCRLYTEYNNRYQLWLSAKADASQSHISPTSRRHLMDLVYQLHQVLVEIHVAIESYVTFIEVQRAAGNGPNCRLSSWQQKNVAAISLHISELRKSLLGISETAISLAPARHRKLKELEKKESQMLSEVMIPCLPRDSPGNDIPSLARLLRATSPHSSKAAFIKKKLISLHKAAKRQTLPEGGGQLMDS